MEMPSAAPWLNKMSQNCTSDRVRSASHAPKLMFMIWAGTGLVSTTYGGGYAKSADSIVVRANDQINGCAVRDAAGAHHVECGLELVAGGCTPGSRRRSRILPRSVAR